MLQLQFSSFLNTSPLLIFFFPFLSSFSYSKQLEDAEEEASELRQKLSSRVTEVNTLTAQLQEKQSQLSLAQLRITQVILPIIGNDCKLLQVF